MNYELLTIHCDGGARGNPGPAASAFVVLDEQGQVVFQQGKYLGIATNNQAEYNAVLLALEWINPGQEKISFILDSELVVKQLTGVYKIKNEDLQQLAKKIWDLIKQKNLLNIKFTHVLRINNAVADNLVNQTLDQQ